MTNLKEKELELIGESDECMLKKGEPSESTQSRSSGSISLESGGSDRGYWGRQLDFLFSCIGYAVGLGNLWRFPYLCMRNGGGAFLIPYFLCLMLCGMPLYFLELVLGQFSSRSPVSMWVISPLFKGLGFAMILVSGIVCIYYNVIMAWALYYMFAAFTAFKSGVLPWATCRNKWNTPACLERVQVVGSENSTVEEISWGNSTLANLTSYPTAQAVINGTINATGLVSKTPSTEFWENNVLELTSGIHELGSVRWQLLLCLLLAWIIVFACLCKGVKSSGKVVYVTATTPYLMLIVLLVRGVTLPGAEIGILYYLKPDFSRLLDFGVWVEASAQIFYSLGPAYGGLITMASYNTFNNNCYRDALMIPLINCGTSFLAGFVVFSVIGFLAHNANLPVDQVITSGPGLAFIVYPEALALLPLAPLWAIIFFAMLVIIGLDTQFGMFETMISGFTDEFPRVFRGKKVWFTGFMCCLQFVLGIPLITQGGLYLFTLMDWYSATFSLMTIATIECIVISWRYGVSRVYSDIELMIGYKPNCWWKACWMIITPLVLLVVLCFTIITFSAPAVNDYKYPPWAVAMGWMMAISSLVPIPVVMAIKLYQTSGSFKKRLIKLSAPSEDWGPTCKEDRKGTIYATVLTASTSKDDDPDIDTKLV